MTPFEAFVLGLLLGLSVAGLFVVLGYKMSRAHENEAREFNAFVSRDEP